MKHRVSSWTRLTLAPLTAALVVLLLGSAGGARHEPGDRDVAGKPMAGGGSEERAVREALAAAPRDPHLHFKLGRLLWEKGDLDGAIASLREMLANNPTNHVNCASAAYDILDMALTRKGDRKGAFEIRREELALRPTNIGALYGVAWYLATATDREQRDPEEAVRLARRMVELDSERSEVWKCLGVALYQAGEWRESVTALNRSMQLGSGGDAYDWVFLAMAEHRLGRTAAARTWLEKATAWRAKNATDDELLGRFLDEADALLHGGAGE